MTGALAPLPLPTQRHCYTDVVVDLTIRSVLQADGQFVVPYSSWYYIDPAGKIAAAAKWNKLVVAKLVYALFGDLCVCESARSAQFIAKMMRHKRGEEVTTDNFYSRSSWRHANTPHRTYEMENCHARSGYRRSTTCNFRKMMDALHNLQFLLSIRYIGVARIFTEVVHSS